MGLLEDILKALDRVEAWKALQEVPAKTRAIEERVTALEASLARCPAEGCPYCGARAWRLERTMMWGQCEIWHCLECSKKREYRYDLPGQLPPGATPNKLTKAKG